MIETNGLQYVYDNRLTLDFPDIRCERGEHWLILGQSGSGKTTFLHLLAGLMRPTKGKIEIENQNLHKLSSASLDHFRGQHIGLIFQKPHFVESLNVSDNLALAQKFAGLPIDRIRIVNLLERLGIGKKVNQPIYRLSQGEQQRVAIARAVINRPALVLADEPTSALDDIHANEVLQLLEETADEVNTTLLIVTHDGRLKSRFSKCIMINAVVNR